MTELWTDATDQALEEHLAATRKERSTPRYGTPYSGSVADFRRGLMKTSAAMDKQAEAARQIVSDYVEARKRDPAAPRPADATWGAMEGCLLASMYAYTIAAIIKIAEQDGGEKLAGKLAGAADDMLMNGDFENLNADVAPEGGTPQVTQGITLTAAAPPADASEAAGQ